MPLSKQAKALYEAALRRKGLQPGKAVRQDPRTFVGPIRTYADKVPSPRYNPDYHWESDAVQRPYDTYWNHRGRFQDLENELSAAIDAGVWERRNPLGNQYYRYYNDGDMPRGIDAETRSYNEGYNDPNFYRYYVPRFYQKPVKVPGYGELYENVQRRGKGTPYLTRLGEMELEARADEMIENDYKDYLKKMYQRFPNREAVREQFPEEYNAMPYLEELFPE